MTLPQFLPRAALDCLMPMHLGLASDGTLGHAGPTMHKLLPPGARAIDDVFVEARGIETGSVMAAIHAADPGRRLSLRLRQHRQLVLRGQALKITADSLLLNFGFGVCLSDAVASFGLTEGDFAPTELALELMFLQEANRAVQQELAKFNRHLMLARRDAERDAHTDALTGLLNRRGLLAAMRVALNPRAPQPFALVHLDLDNFKLVNDRLGHGAGDRMLCAAGQVLTRAVRSGDHVARIGGDEFVLFLGGAWSREALIATGTRIIRGIEAASPEGCAVSASIGVVLSQGYGPNSIDQMLHDADVALYESKRLGKGRVSLAEGGGAMPPPAPR